VLALVREGTEDGTLEAAEEDLISHVFRFTERRVRSLMTPRTQMVAVAVDTPFIDVWQGYSFEAVDMDERRIDKILLHRQQIDSGTQTEGAPASGAVLSSIPRCWFP
jgi:CBS domain containing-hemolysin-like protein